MACDVVAYDYLPLLDEMDYVPTDHYAKGPEIFAHCQAIARKYNLYELAVFHTTVTSTVWDEDEQMWHLTTDRGDRMKARFVICANGTLSKPKLAKINGMETFKGHSFHTSRWDYAYTKRDLSGLDGQSRRHHRHRRDRRAGDSGPGRGGQGALRLPAHAFVDRYPRRLADRSQLGAPTEARMAGQAPRAREDASRS